MTATAEVKPASTGYDRKLTRNPNRIAPISELNRADHRSQQDRQCDERCGSRDGQGAEPQQQHQRIHCHRTDGGLTTGASERIDNHRQNGSVQTHDWRQTRQQRVSHALWNHQRSRRSVPQPDSCAQVRLLIACRQPIERQQAFDAHRPVLRVGGAGS